VQDCFTTKAPSHKASHITWCLCVFVVNLRVLSYPVPTSGRGVWSRISWVIYLSKIRDPTQPLAFLPSRDCRGSFLPIVKTVPITGGKPFFVPGGNLFPGAPPSIRCPDRILKRQLRAPSLCLLAFVVTALRFSPVPLDLGPALADLRLRPVVNYLRGQLPIEIRGRPFSQLFMLLQLRV
jgi:hypothetical protein